MSRKVNVIIVAPVNFALLPVKGLAHGKSRLLRLLSDDARRALLQAMFLDVLASVLRAPSVHAVAVVSSDRFLLDLAVLEGVLAVDEGYPRGLNGAVDLGAAFCVENGASALLVLLADVPLVSPADVEAVFRGLRGEPEAIVVPSKEGDGVNALLRVPPHAIQPCFVGGPSLEAHRAEARRKNVPCRVVDIPGIALDIDSVEDLQVFGSEPTDTRAYREAARLGLLRPRAQRKRPGLEPGPLEAADSGRLAAGSAASPETAGVEAGAPGRRAIGHSGRR